KRISILHIVLCKTLMCRSRNIMAHHKFLGKVLTSLQGSGRLLGSDYGNTFKLAIVKEKIVDPVDQGVFRTYHDHFYVLGNNSFFNGFEIVYTNRYIFGDLGSTCIPRGYKKLIEFWT